MTVVNPKSISGINSITTGSGSDDILTIHTNNGTERLRVDSTGATKIVTGIVTTLTATTGIVTTLTTNTLTANSTAKVGSGVTLSPDGDLFVTGVCTATSFVGSGANLTGITGTTINNNADNRVITGSGTANTLEGESGLTYDGTNLNISAGANNSGMSLTAANNNQITTFSITGKASDGTSHTFDLNVKRASNRFDIEGGGSARLSITSDGYIGVNQTAPSSELQVGGGTNPMTAKPTFHVAPSSGNAAMSLRGGSPSIYFDGTGGGHTRFLTDGTDIAISNGNLDSSGNERFRFRADGGLCFGGDTAAANALDDYEEGTWTPTINQGFSPSYSTQSGSYTKIGDMVYFNCYMQYSSNSGSNSQGTYGVLNGLPFTSTYNNNLLGYAVNVPWQYQLGQTVEYAYVDQNSTLIQLLLEPSGGDRQHTTASSLWDGGDTRIAVSGWYKTNS